MKNLCEDDGICKTTSSSTVYRSCVIPLSQGKGVPETTDCVCNNKGGERATIDVYFWNNTNDNLTMVGPCDPEGNDQGLNWIILGKHKNRCDIGFWLVPPPCSVGPGEAFFARGYSGDRTGGDDCKRDAIYHICLTYGIDGKEENSVTIALCRERKGSGKGSKCDDFDRVSSRGCQQSTQRGNLKLATTNLKRNGNETRASYQFIVTGGSVGPKCTRTPDNCPMGNYCNESFMCTAGCKIAPDSCTPPQICDPTSRVCMVPQTCSTHKECKLDSFCKNDQCIVGCTETSDNCAQGKTCQNGFCTAVTGTTGTNGGGKLSRGTIIILVMVGIIFVFLVIAGIIYFSYQPSTKPKPPE